MRKVVCVTRQKSMVCAPAALTSERDSTLQRAGPPVSVWRVFCGAGVWERDGRWGCRDCDATSARSQCISGRYAMFYNTNFEELNIFIW